MNDYQSLWESGQNVQKNRPKLNLTAGLFLLIITIICGWFLYTNAHILHVKQSANGSSGTFWKYELSTENVIQEKKYYTTQFLGSGYTQHWIFEIIGEGEVTIHWLAYTYGDYTESKSYSTTYWIGEDRKWIQVSDN